MSSVPSYTVFIRLPFARGDFVDPISVEWDASKDKALWKILSKASKNSDIDWNELATKFEVTLAFLLQQAAWLYERQLLQVRAQMRKVGVSKGSAAPSPVPWNNSESGGGEGMRRTGSGGGGPRVASALSSRKDTPVPKNESPTSGRPLAPPFSRTSSANTTITSRNLPPPTSPRPQHAVLKRSLSPAPKPRHIPTSQTLSPSSSSSSESVPTHQSRLLRRPSRFSKKSSSGKPPSDLIEDSEDEEPAFMPILHQDPSATLRGDPRNISTRGKGPAHGSTSRKQVEQSQTSDSSASSTPVSAAVDKAVRNERPVGPLSPRRTAELAGTRKGSGKGSDGTPSMGSSFSDLDDASVTQSALEEALASNMQAGGGMASRMSSISHALRSKYL
ncbi:related to Autophagy-related protein 29 [Rhynchosporium agropyri]|uniref:Autophagy-related protein 29 n=1 Tax=Rhynchosporium agropyri TaxID=914238 RepID=A0A1E1L7Q5_9HELO|nr:related to Autophagy-related protein 29 [Rhynchosporium agropyri]